MKQDDRRREIESFYRRYNRCCNDHEFGQLSEFVADNVQVNGQAQSLEKYIAGLRAVTAQNSRSYGQGQSSSGAAIGFGT